MGILILALSDWQAVAGSFGSRVVFQIQQGQYCGEVSREDQYAIYPETEPAFREPGCTEHSRFERALLDFRDSMTANPALEIEHRIMGEAAERQISNDQCMVSILDNMQENPVVMGMWKRMLFNSWLRARKARALLARCDRIRAPLGAADWRRDPERRANLHWQLANDILRPDGNGGYVEAPIDRPPTGYKWERFADTQEKAQQLVDFCLNQERYQALETSQAYFMQTVPLINSTSFQDALTENQNLITSRATGEPLTDDELLEINLENPNGMAEHIRVAPGLFGAIDTALAETRAERNNQANELRSTLDGGNRDRVAGFGEAALERFDNMTPGARLSQAQKEYLYHQGMVHEALEARGQLREDFQGNLTGLTAPAVCLMSGYETSFTGEALNFALTGLVGGGALTALRGGLMIARGARAAQAATRWQRVGNFATAGFTDMGVREVADGCFINHNDEGMPSVSTPDTPDMIRVGANLPDEVGPAPQVIPTGPGEGQQPWSADVRQQMNAINQVIRTPQCSGKYGFLRQHIERVGCVEAALLNMPGVNMTGGLALEGFFMLN